MGNPENGMITLELESKTASELEGHKATVRDHNGRILLEGSLCQGRLARRIEKAVQYKSYPLDGNCRLKIPLFFKEPEILRNNMVNSLFSVNRLNLNRTKNEDARRFMSKRIYQNLDAV
jgi:hypothetical protein